MSPFKQQLCVPNQSVDLDQALKLQMRSESKSMNIDETPRNNEIKMHESLVIKSKGEIKDNHQIVKESEIEVTLNFNCVKMNLCYN